ncbi:hypothetical protein L596_012266 [Steinernema carpocapsae]|uniref:Uncharacterized protein n=1 Tax=Steinernema carpocapsae TaxID=34508 RepID=A0A4U5NX68_STECR|nr:hypothetical protein L596_012266 [Steinernema carpocapsae]
MASPLTIAMYGWNDSQAVLYNDPIQTGTCLISVSQYVVLGYTPIGRLDKRLLILFGLTMFSIYHVVNMPYPFYGSHMDYIPLGKYAPTGTDRNSVFRSPGSQKSRNDAGSFCLLWKCFQMHFTAFVHVRNSFLASLISGFRIVFEKSGYLWPTSGQLALLVLGMVLVIGFRNRLVALKIVPRSGVPMKYKKGTFYKL